ncbi:hypothetical protein [Jeotgalibacillus malaysiensis]
MGKQKLQVSSTGMQKPEQLAHIIEAIDENTNIQIEGVNAYEE